MKEYEKQELIDAKVRCRDLAFEVRSALESIEELQNTKDLEELAPDGAEDLTQISELLSEAEERLEDAISDFEERSQSSLGL